jgi:hypothetical protein
MSHANNTEQWEKPESDPLEGIEDGLDADALNNVCEKAQTKTKCDDLEPDHRISRALRGFTLRFLVRKLDKWVACFYD